MNAVAATSRSISYGNGIWAAERGLRRELNNTSEQTCAHCKGSPLQCTVVSLYAQGSSLRRKSRLKEQRQVSHSDRLDYPRILQKEDSLHLAAEASLSRDIDGQVHPQARRCVNGLKFGNEGAHGSRDRKGHSNRVSSAEAISSESLLRRQSGLHRVADNNGKRHVQSRYSRSQSEAQMLEEAEVRRLSIHQRNRHRAEGWQAIAEQDEATAEGQELVDLERNGSASVRLLPNDGGRVDAGAPELSRSSKEGLLPDSPSMATELEAGRADHMAGVAEPPRKELRRETQSDSSVQERHPHDGHADTPVTVLVYQTLEAGLGEEMEDRSSVLIPEIRPESSTNGAVKEIVKEDKRTERTLSLPVGEVVSKASQQSESVKAAWMALVRWSRSWRSSANHEDNALVKTTKIAVLGGGSFGTAMGVMLARNKADMDVVLLLRNPDVCEGVNHHNMNKKAFPRHKLPKNVRATTDPREALDGAQYCIHAVPVQASAEFLRSIAEYVPPTLPILSVSKGLEVGTMEMMSQVIPRALGNPRQPVVVLSGPSFSIELMDELPTGLVAASKDKQLARAAQQLLASRYLRVNTSTDVVGVEMAGALKNVLAIAAGIVEGMNLGNNCMAALVAQGCSEIRWLAEKMGANPATLAGLAGTGDIMLTCFVNLSRNRSVGVRLGAGEKLEDILASMSQVAEGVATAGAVIALARKYRVQMPVLTAVARILENKLTPKKAVLELMTLPQVEDR